MTSSDKRSYRVEYSEDGETFWYLRVPEISRSTCAEGWDEAEFMARDLIALMTEQDPDAFDIEFHRQPPEDE